MTVICVVLDEFTPELVIQRSPSICLQAHVYHVIAHVGVGRFRPACHRLDGLSLNGKLLAHVVLDSDGIESIEPQPFSNLAFVFVEIVSKFRVPLRIPFV